MARDIRTAVREICFSYPEVEERTGDGMPDYIGHQGWIDLDVEDRFDWDEVQQLAMGSYRHFALKRMLKALPDSLRVRGDP